MAGAIVAARMHRKDEDPHNGALGQGKMPQKRDILEDRAVSRRVISALGIQWPERRMVLTGDHVYFSKTSDERAVIDIIPVLEIEKVQPLPGRLAHTSSSRSPDPRMARMHSKIDLWPSSATLDTNGAVEDYDEDRNPEHVFVIHTKRDGPCSG